MILEVCRVSAHLVSEARRIRPTHVFLPDFQTVLRNAPALVWLRLRGVQVIARLGNAPEPGLFYRSLWKWGVAPFVETFVCISDFVVHELLAVGVEPGKVLRIHNAPERRHRLTTADASDRISNRVIFVGQIIPEKGLDLLLDAVGLLRGRGYGVTLDIVGDLDGWEAPRYRGYRAGVRARAARPDLAGAVNFLGWRDDVAALLARASVHCCPSRPEQREALGNVVLEAKVAGLPSVVGPSGALPSLIEHRVNGWACAEPTPAALAEGLEFFLADPARLTAAQRASRASASAFSIEQFRDRWARVFAV
jgi:glycosyltransferase involved in cell wall biosynthesis